MKMEEVIVVRIYITESSALLPQIVTYLKKEAGIRGVSVFRAISGYGDTGVHSVNLVDLSLDLPLTIEFFDVKNKIDTALEQIKNWVSAEHIIFWQAHANA